MPFVRVVEAFSQPSSTERIAFPLPNGRDGYLESLDDQAGSHRGARGFIWFGAIEHPLLMRFLLALGADGLMVDDLSALAEILGR